MRIHVRPFHTELLYNSRRHLFDNIKSVRFQPPNGSLSSLPTPVKLLWGVNAVGRCLARTNRRFAEQP